MKNLVKQFLIEEANQDVLEQSLVVVEAYNSDYEGWLDEIYRMEAAGWYWGQHFEYDGDKLDYFTCWTKFVDGKEFLLFDTTKLQQIEAEIQKFLIRSPLVAAGLVGESNDGDFICTDFGSFYNIEGAWFGVQA